MRTVFVLDILQYAIIWTNAVVVYSQLPKPALMALAASL